MDTASLSIRVSQEGADSTAQALSRVASSGGQAEESFGSLALKIAGFTSLANIAVDVGRKVVSGLVDMGKEAVSLAASFEKSRMTWGVLVGDMNKGSQVFDKLFNFAAKTPLSFEAVNQAATTLKAFGVQTDSLIPTLSKLGDVAMGDNGKLQSLALAYGKVATQGFANTRELMEFVNAGVPIFDLLGKSMNVSTDSIKKLAEEGKVGFSDLQTAMQNATNSGGQFFGMMDRTAKTAIGEWTTAQDNFKASLARVGDTLLNVIVPALRTYNSVMDDINNKKITVAVLSGQNQSKEDINTALSFITKKINEIQKDPKLMSLYSGGPIQGDIFSHIEQAGYDDRRNNAERAYNQIQEDIEKAKSATNAKDLPALIAAQQDLIKKLAVANVNPSGSSGGGTPAGSGDGSAAPFYHPLDEQHIKNASWSDIPVGSNPWAARFAKDQDITNAEWWQVPVTGRPPVNISDLARAAGGGMQGTPPASGVNISDLARHAGALIRDKEAAERDAEAQKKLNDILKQLGEGLKNVGLSAAESTFSAIGKALAEGAQGGQSMKDSMKSIVDQAVSSMGPLMMSAGLQLMLGGSPGLGIALFLAGGGMEIVGGYMSSSSSSSSSTSTAADIAELTKYYQQAEAFNQQSSQKAALHAYAGGTDYAAGGWSWVGERGPELMRVPQGAQILPNHIARGYADGLNIPASVSVVINNNAEGTKASAEETTDSSGARMVVVTIEKVVKNMVAKGGLDGALAIAQARKGGKKVAT